MILRNEIWQRQYVQASGKKIRDTLPVCTAIIMCSPLKPASNLLRLLRLIGGFPLMAKDSSWTSFEFCKCYTIYHVLTYGIHGIPLAIYL